MDTSGLETSLTRLESGIDERIRLETAYVDTIKNGLVEIIRDMRECVYGVDNALAGDLTSATRDRLNARITGATNRLRQLDPLVPNNILEPFGRYAARNIRNDDANKSSATIFENAQPTLVERVFGRRQVDAPSAQAPQAQAQAPQAPKSPANSPTNYSELAKDSLSPHHDLIPDVDEPIKHSSKKEVRPPINTTQFFKDHIKHKNSVSSPLIPQYEIKLPSVYDAPDYFHSSSTSNPHNHNYIDPTLGPYKRPTGSYDENDPFADLNRRADILGGWKQNRSKRIRSKRHSKRR